MSHGYSRLMEKKVLTDRGDDDLFYTQLFVPFNLNYSALLCILYTGQLLMNYQKFHAIQIN